MVVREVPEARLSLNDKKSSLDEVYFNTKHALYKMYKFRYARTSI